MYVYYKLNIIFILKTLILFSYIRAALPCYYISVSFCHPSERSVSHSWPVPYNKNILLCINQLAM